ncbi:hypothetical protein L596_000699 [Steinernema carpocapsae]|uniref:Uncharacterized protein n=1 Tax=Steinernema carpocapsae TaxID=34508 RepID=A0A4U8UJJ5_STECR|nr:hypothetical protein L596_000699 [Steinernema carpocapsae]
MPLWNNHFMLEIPKPVFSNSVLHRKRGSRRNTSDNAGDSDDLEIRATSDARTWLIDSRRLLRTTRGFYSVDEDENSFQNQIANLSFLTLQKTTTFVHKDIKRLDNFVPCTWPRDSAEVLLDIKVGFCFWIFHKRVFTFAPWISRMRKNKFAFLIETWIRGQMKYVLLSKPMPIKKNNFKKINSKVNWRRSLRTTFADLKYVARPTGPNTAIFS